MQKIGGIDVPADMVAGEITYGLERLAMYIQDKDNYLDLAYCEGVKYGDVNTQSVEKEECEYYQNYQEDTEFLKQLFTHSLENAKKLVEQNMKQIAYEQCLIASHTLNILDARHELSQTERKNWILEIREVVANVC